MHSLADHASLAGGIVEQIQAHFDIVAAEAVKLSPGRAEQFHAVYKGVVTPALFAAVVQELASGEPSLSCLHPSVGPFGAVHSRHAMHAAEECTATVSRAWCGNAFTVAGEVAVVSRCMLSTPFRLLHHCVLLYTFCCVVPEHCQDAPALGLVLTSAA